MRYGKLCYNYIYKVNRKVGFELKDWNCRIAECGEVDIV